MTRNIIALIGLVLLAGCSGGGDSSTTSSAPPPATPTAQPDMLTATPQGLLRGKANGQGQQLIFSRPNFHQATVLVSEGNVVYSRGNNTENEDIWTVRADGTGDHALLNTPDGEYLKSVSGHWALLSKFIRTRPFERWSVRVDTGEQFMLTNEGYDTEPMDFQGSNRVTIIALNRIFSVTLTGTDRINYDEIPNADDYFTGSLSIANSVVYMIRGIPPASPPAVLFAVPANGGNRVQFESDEFYTYPFGSIGSRLIYQRCSGDYPNLFACDAISANPDNTGKVVLAGEPSNEAVQGVTTDQVIIRRNLSGNDHLIAVPIAGGPEKLLMTMTDSEFVDLIVGDLLIVRRPSGTWSLDLNGTLTKLGTVVGDSGFVAVGNAVCVTKVTAVWCMPLDGSGPQVKITDNGKVVGVL